MKSSALKRSLKSWPESVQDTGYTKYDENGEKLGSTYDKGTGTYTEFGEDCKAGHLRVQIDGLVHSGGKGYHKLDAGTDGDGIGIATDSKWLYDIIGSDEIELIATAHHQSIDPENLAEGLTVVAKSSDGYHRGRGVPRGYIRSGASMAS